MKSNTASVFASALGLIAVVACQPEGSATESVSANAAPPAEVDPAEEDVVAARIGDRRITLDALDAYIRDELFESATSGGDAAKLYELRSKHIERMVDLRVIEAAAEGSGLSAEEFVNQEVDALGPISDEEVAAYYAANTDKMGGATLEQIAPRIQTFLRSERAFELISGLRESANAEVLLEPARVEVAATGPSRGPEGAPVTIIEFSDFQCPYCKRVAPTIAEILGKYPEQVRLVFRHLPLDRIHPRARPAAEAAVCADDQGQFWAYHDRIFSDTGNLADEDLERFASELGLEMEAFQRCLSEGTSDAVVSADAEAAAALGLRGTPAFFVNGIPLRGAQPASQFVSIIEEELARELSGGSAPSS